MVRTAARRTLGRCAVAVDLMVIRGDAAAFRRPSLDDVAVARTFLSAGFGVLSADGPVAANAAGAETSNMGTETSNARNSRDSVVT